MEGCQFRSHVAVIPATKRKHLKHREKTYTRTTTGKHIFSVYYAYVATKERSRAAAAHRL